MNLKEQLVQSRELIQTVEPEGLQEYFFEDETDEKTAWLIVQSSTDRPGDSEMFEVRALAFLLRSGFAKQAAIDNLPAALFENIDTAEALEIIACTPFRIPSELSEDLKNSTSVIAIYDDWNYRIYILENPRTKMCFAWKTTA